MTKTEYLTLLEERLAIIPDAYRNDAIAYYEEIIDDYIDSGYSETTALSYLPSVDDLAEKILSDPALASRKKNVHSRRESMHAAPIRKPRRELKGWEIALLVLLSPLWLSLLLAAILLAIGFFVFCFFLAIAVYALDFGLAAVAIAALLCVPIPALLQTSLTWLLLLLGVAFLCGGLSILLFRAANRLSIYLLRLCRYLFYRGIAKFRERRVEK